MSEQLLENFHHLNDNFNLSDFFEKMMKDFYPKVKNLNSRIALDLGFLYIYRQLDNENDRDYLIEFWSKHSNAETIQLPMGEYHYKPYTEFLYLDKIMNGLFIETLLEQIQKFRNLSFIESCAILFDLERYYVVPLSEMDVKIIEAVRDSIKLNCGYNNDFLSEKLNVRSNYISRRIGYLRNNAYFRITGTSNYPKIGLNLFIVLLNASPEFIEMLPEYFASPFTRTIRRCPNQRYNYIISLTIPNFYENELKDYLKKLKDQNIIFSYYFDEVESIANNLDFSYYNYSKRPTVLSGIKPGFYVDWFKERILSMSNNQKVIDNPFHRFHFGGEKVDLSELDLKIMSIYKRDLDRSVRTIAKYLDLSWEETNLHIERIKPLLFPMILLYYMGLNQTAILFYDKISSSNLNKIEKLLLRLPQSFSYTFKNGGAIITVDLMNGAHRLNDLICENLPEIKNTQFSLASKTSGIFRPIPYRYYNEKENNWILPEGIFPKSDLKI
ncbi:MAG: hypothetical protein JXA54_03740 [Candidatus Heimdallarchaeota archaeon]|nr:hypothetical protein [Candidatus Heimdallarchaeota archaeon]